MITFQLMSGALGAEVRGLDLRQPLDAGMAKRIHEALKEHMVLVFREQALLSFDEHRAFARHFGEIQPISFTGANDLEPDVLILDETDPTGANAASEAANFHTDNTFRPMPPNAVVLQARIMPEAGGDTCVASTAAAYEALSGRMKAYLEGLEASHSYAQMVARLRKKGKMPNVNLADFPPINHPVVARHPETGRKMLFVNYNYTTHIEGLPTHEGEMILRYLFEHLKSPEFHVRVRWRPGDVVVWDNLATQHYAVPDYRERRVLHRITIRGRRQVENAAAPAREAAPA